MSYQSNQINIYIFRKISQYKQFMSIDIFPKIKVSVVNINVPDCLQSKYVALTNHKYRLNDHSHTLEVPELFINNNHADYLLYHELTHAYDIFKYAQNDSNRACALNAFTEYHAAQIELIKLLNFSSVKHTKPFLMTDCINTVFGKCSVTEYINDRYTTIFRLVTHQSFKHDRKTLIVLLAVVFNYFGYISICRMYAGDFCEDQFYFDAIKKIIPHNVVEILKKLLAGWLDDYCINILCDGYTTILQNIFHEYGFLELN